MLPAALASRVNPKPTAKQVRWATAIALAEDYVAETRTLCAERDRLAAELDAAITVFAKANFDTVEKSFSGVGSIRFLMISVSCSEAGCAELSQRWAAAERAYDRRPNKTANHFMAELSAAAKGYRSPTEELLLDDPEIKAALLSAGRKALSRPTAADKAAAIES
jgi:hypothetical protein